MLVVLVVLVLVVLVMVMAVVVLVVVLVLVVVMVVVVMLLLLVVIVVVGVGGGSDGDVYTCLIAEKSIERESKRVVENLQISCLFKLRTYNDLLFYISTSQKGKKNPDLQYTSSINYTVINIK